MEPIGNLLPKSVNRANISRQVEAAEVVSLAQDFLNRLLGEKSDLAFVRSFWDGTINVDCTNSAIANEIGLHTKELIRSLRDRIPDTQIKRIRTRLNLKSEL